MNFNGQKLKYILKMKMMCIYREILDVGYHLKAIVEVTLGRMCFFYILVSFVVKI